VKLEGKLLAGQTFVSTPGRLACKAVIHAVGPTWRGGQHNEENQLYAAVTQCMDDASSRGLQTIAVPAVSTGVFRFPLQRAVDIILRASRDYLIDPRSAACLTEVHIVDSDRQVVSSFETALRSMTPPPLPRGHEDEEQSEPQQQRQPVRQVRTQNTRELHDYYCCCCCCCY